MAVVESKLDAVGEQVGERVAVRSVSRRADGALIALLAALGTLAAGVRFNDQLVGLTGDNAAYILLARALLTGQPYDNPEYPWGYPLALTPILAAVGPDNILAAIPWMKLLSVLLFVASLPLIYLLFRTRHRHAPAFAATALFAVNDITLSYANDVMSEIPFICASFGALLFWQKKVAPRLDEPEGPLPWRDLATAGALLMLAYYIRTVGTALLAGATLLLLLYKRWKIALLLGAGFALAALPWVLFSSGMGKLNYAGKFFLRDPYDPTLGEISSVGEFFQRAWETALLYVQIIFPVMVVSPQVARYALNVAALVMGVLLLAGFLSRLTRRVELPELYAMFFLMALFAWPWRADRFLLPVYPLLLHYIIEGAMRLWDWASRVTLRHSGATRSRAATMAAVALVVLAAMPYLWLAGSAATSNLGYLQGRTPPSGHTPDWQRYFEACRWLGERSPPGSVVMSRKSTLTTIYAGRPSLLTPLIPPDDYPQFMRDNRVDYAIEDAFVWSTHTQQYLRPALRAHPEMFQLVYETSPPVTRVWKVVR